MRGGRTSALLSAFAHSQSSRMWANVALSFPHSLHKSVTYTSGHRCFANTGVITELVCNWRNTTASSRVRRGWGRAIVLLANRYHRVTSL
uniref:Putative secreted protein n=1 Tax=Ixodes ricinus TaxID=34613 RepID=A0A6B0U0T3_IXORI